MKFVDDEMLQKLKENTKIKDDKEISTIPFFSDSTDIEALDKYDKLKSRVLKFVLYKKRSEAEIKTKFSKEIEEETLNSIILDLKRNKNVLDKYNFRNKFKL